MKRWWPQTLASRLIVTAVILVALTSVFVGGLTTLAMRTYLTGQLDDQVRQSFGRALAHPPSGFPPPDGQPSGEPRDPDDRLGQGAGTLTVVISNNVASGDVITAAGSRTALTRTALAPLVTVPADGQVHEVSVPSQGEYRVLARSIGDATIVSGLPTAQIDHTINSLLVAELLLTVLGVGVAAVVGRRIVRHQLLPLNEVAQTAHRVAELPLSRGEIELEDRVPAHLTDPDTEVGQVGAALNTLLDHVETSLVARELSERRVRQFVADASHELRTPLATIKGYAELAGRRPEDTAGVGLALAKVESESTRMTGLVEDLLLLARLDSGRPLEREPVDLARLLVEAVSDARVVSPEHRWRVAVPDHSLDVTGDERSLHQVITNLLNNARKYTPAGTTVTVTARPDGFDVHDDGPGFPADLVPVAFERFARGDAARTRGTEGGTGLGLALVKAIVAAHGGTVSLASEPGDTTIGVRLPQ